MIIIEARHAKPCTHPAIVVRDGRNYCTECGVEV